MEVFMALFTTDLQIIIPPCVITLEKNTFESELAAQKILFLGDGATKWRGLAPTASQAVFQDHDFLAEYLGIISFDKLRLRQFTDLINSEPVYIKDVHIHINK